MKHQFNVNGMHGQHCVMIITDALSKENVKAKVHLEKHIVEVEYHESEQSIETIKETIEELGYDVS
ncbi:copper chaperone [Seinonella peptonophila]|uniref:Copper chaperone n=1 Tax=Seinonella peptonophila TaxID=112248 RepID=A0A1M4U1M6_9BACL|nr:cation transporter [Seinonella peptonophila]SHE50629.1 copper chaperone [Seinonella peptonophila]